MHSETNNTQIFFKPGDWIIDVNNPGQPGQYTGNFYPAGPHYMVELSFPNGERTYRPLTSLAPMPQTRSLEDRLLQGNFGKTRDLQRLITFEKLRGTLHEVIYSMEAAQIDFYPYQFKPVLKFINSPTERLIIADEVGLGKTIESAMIWIELQARRQAQRLLVICPKILAEKWRYELRSKFLLDAHIVDFDKLNQEIKELKHTGPGHHFIFISTYTGLRPPKAELKLLDTAPDEDFSCSPKTLLLRELRFWPEEYNPFDLIIFDEAHYMRNPATTTFHLGEGLAANAGAVLCVSATPINNSNTDLHSLLRLIDENFFETQGLFEELLEANRPTVKMSNALSHSPIDIKMLENALQGMGGSQFISQSPLFEKLLELLDKPDFKEKSQIAKCQDIVEKLNLLGGYINRTRRVQVSENRPIRDPVVLLVEYSLAEMQLYKLILKIVRNKCRKDSRPFHVFQVLGLQLRAASCLPVLSREIKDGRFGDAEGLFSEAFGEEVFDDLFEDKPFEELIGIHNEQLLEYDFETNDSKYKELKEMLLTKIPSEKVVIFAYYRPTLEYLRRRLTSEGVNVSVIHGGIPNEQRWDEIDRFRDPRGPRILLSSEVGSEGIDLQFCRVLVNYDLPWNPMRVEQRIGRIDRVGQKAERLSIINFKVKDTIEERLYDRLHSKLERFANSLGDLEDIIGREVQRLTIELLSRELTPEQELAQMDHAELVIENRLIAIQALEESGDALTALSDYVQRKIEEDRGKGRYLQPEELEDYLADFFEREFRGCEINYNTPGNGCFHIRLTQVAKNSLNSFMQHDNSLNAQPFWQKEFNITFRREVMQRLQTIEKRKIHFVNHLSPLIRWITQINKDKQHNFYNVSAVLINYPDIPLGDYCYRIERWSFNGLSNREILAYGIKGLSSNSLFLMDKAETIVQTLLRQGRDWDYADCDKEQLITSHQMLEKQLQTQFQKTLQDFEAENQTAYQIKVQRVNGFFDRRIEQDVQRLHTLRARDQFQGAIRMVEGRLNKAKENKKNRLQELANKAKLDMGQSEVAAGIFHVVKEVL